MGGGRARQALAAGLFGHGYDVILGNSAAPPDADVYVFDSPIQGRPSVGDRPWAVMRHGDCQVAFLAYESLGAGVPLITPTQWAYERMLGWRLPRHRVQWMSLSIPADLQSGEIRDGKKILHVRAWDFQKDTGLALRVMSRLPTVPCLLRQQAGTARSPVSHNVTVLPATADQDALWDDVGCLLVTSRQETFCIAAHEALARGIPVVAHQSLGALAEWSGGAISFGDTEDELATLAMEALEWQGSFRDQRIKAAQQAFDVACKQMAGLIPFIQESFSV